MEPSNDRKFQFNGLVKGRGENSFQIVPPDQINELFVRHEQLTDQFSSVSLKIVTTDQLKDESPLEFFATGTDLSFNHQEKEVTILQAVNGKGASLQQLSWRPIRGEVCWD